MKVLIIDDEQHVITAIRKLADWKQYGIDAIFEANEPNEALRIMTAERPEIVISDVVLHNRTGIELMPDILAISPHTKIIFISGYNQFSYVRSALQQGSIDYILKPIDETQINEAVSKAVSHYQDEEKRILMEQSSIKVSFELMKYNIQKLFLALVFGRGNLSEVYTSLCELDPAFSNISSCIVGIIPLEHLNTEVLIKKSADPAPITVILNRLMVENELGIAVSVTYNPGEVALLFLKTSADIKGRCCQMLQIVYDETGIRLDIGLSSILPFPAMVREGAAKARLAAKSYNILEPYGIVHDSCPTENQVLPFDFQRFQDTFFAAVLHGSESGIRSAVHALAEEILSAGFLCIRQLEQIREIYYGMRINWFEYFRRNNFLEDHGTDFPPFIFIFPFDDNGVFSVNHLEDVLCKDIINISKFLLTSSPKNNTTIQLLYQVMQFITKNYAKKISQQEIAEQFFVNTSYLSHIFKQHYGMGMIDYINHLRIEKAKSLLTGSRISISDLVEMVGFTDEKYFSRIFKKLEGVTPSEYRNMR